MKLMVLLALMFSSVAGYTATSEDVVLGMRQNHQTGGENCDGELRKSVDGSSISKDATNSEVTEQ